MELSSGWSALAIFVGVWILIGLVAFKVRNYYKNGNGKYKRGGLARLKQKAESGDAAAQVELGHVYTAGKVVSQDLEIAREWYEKAAAQNEPVALMVLGAIYTAGRGVDVDLERAAQCYLQAAEIGKLEAQLMCAYIYVRGLGVARSDDTAREWLNQAMATDRDAATKYLKQMSDDMDDLIGGTIKKWHVQA